MPSATPISMAATSLSVTGASAGCRVDVHGLVGADLPASSTAATARPSADLVDLQQGAVEVDAGRCRRAAGRRTPTPGHRVQRSGGADDGLGRAADRRPRCDGHAVGHQPAADLGALGVEADRDVGVAGGPARWWGATASGGVCDRLMRNRSTPRSSRPRMTSARSEAGPSVHRILIFTLDRPPRARPIRSARRRVPPVRHARGERADPGHLVGVELAFPGDQVGPAVHRPEAGLGEPAPGQRPSVGRARAPPVVDRTTSRSAPSPKVRPSAAYRPAKEETGSAARSS